MAKTSEAQLKAVRKYDQKRKGTLVSTRLTPEQLAALDTLRGEQSRSAFITDAILAHMARQK